jgi:hypothetical protein
VRKMRMRQRMLHAANDTTTRCHIIERIVHIRVIVQQR